MPWKFNPFSGTLDQTGSGGGGGGSAFFTGEVATYADLPLDGTAPLDSRWLVRTNSGTWPFSTYKQAGVYVRSATVGANRDDDYTLTDTSFHDVMSDAAFLLFDEGDATKNLKFQLSGITTATTRTLTVPDASGTIALNETFAAPPSIGSTTANAGSFTTLAANNGTLTASAPVLDLAQTWNNSGVTFTALRINATNTASALNSRLLEFQVDGSRRLSFDVTTTPAGNPSNRVDISSAATEMFVLCNATQMMRFTSAGNRVEISRPTLGWTNDTFITREAADALAMVRTTNAQTFRIYNTFTDASNHERGFMRWSSNVLQIGTEKAGTGSARNLEFQTDGTTRVTILTTGQMGIGTTNPNRPLHISASDAMGRIDRIGAAGPAFLMVRMATAGTVSSSWLFGPATGFASVADDDFSIIDFGTAVGGVSGTQRLTIAKSDGQLTVNGNLNLSTKDLVTDTTTGTKIGTATTQKIGFFDKTPVVQQAAIADATDAATTQARLNDLLATMRTFGLIAT